MNRACASSSARPLRCTGTAGGHRHWERRRRATAYVPGHRVLLDAHNAYPEQGLWRDRIDRALATGVPLALEQDLAWVCEPPAPCSSVLSHNPPFTGEEPTLRDHFFERIRPIVERALAAGDRRDWPIITLNLDFKSDEPEHHAAVWALLGEYEAWLATAARTESVEDVAALDVGPVLVLTGAADAQRNVISRWRARGRAPPSLRRCRSRDHRRRDERRSGAPPPDVFRDGVRTTVAGRTTRGRLSKRAARARRASGPLRMRRGCRRLSGGPTRQASGSGSTRSTAWVLRSCRSGGHRRTILVRARLRNCAGGPRSRLAWTSSLPISIEAFAASRASMLSP